MDTEPGAVADRILHSTCGGMADTESAVEPLHTPFNLRWPTSPADELYNKVECLDPVVTEGQYRTESGSDRILHSTRDGMVKTEPDPIATGC